MPASPMPATPPRTSQSLTRQNRTGPIQTSPPPHARADAGTAVVPWLFCRNVEASVEWLAAAFGCERRTIVAAPDGSGFAEVSFEGHVVMLGTPPDGAPLPHGPCRHGAVVVITREAAALAARAAHHGAAVEQPSASGAGCRVRDPDGHLWVFVSPAG